MGKLTTKAGLVVYDREAWGARAPRSAYGQLGPVERVGVHHGGPVGPPRYLLRLAILTLRSWQDYHMDVHKWNDAGYHFAMDGRGRVYRIRPTWALGAHTLNNNSNCLGIVVMQDGRFHGLNRRQKKAFRILFDKGIPELGVDPFKSHVQHPSSDHYVRVHRRFPGQSTECPGNLIEADIDTLIQEYR